MDDIISWALPTPLWSLLYTTIVVYDTQSILLLEQKITLCFIQQKEGDIADQLSHVGIMASSHTSHNQKRKDVLSDISIGVGFPPVLMRLAKKIESGAFTEMSDLLPKHMGIHRWQNDRSKCSEPQPNVLLLLE